MRHNDAFINDEIGFEKYTRKSEEEVIQIIFQI